MLMALLPLAGWALPEDPVAPDAKTGLVYNGGDQTLVTAGVAQEGKAYYYAVVPKDDDAPVANDYGEANNLTEIVGKNAGGYDVYFVEAAEAPNGTTAPAGATKITVTIARKPATVAINANALADHHLTYGWKAADFTTGDFDLDHEGVQTAQDVFLGLLVGTKTGFVGTDGNNVVVVPNWGNDVNTKGYYDAGEHNFSLSVNSMANYSISLVPSTGKWYVDQKNLTISADANTTLTYGDVFNKAAASTHVTYDGFVANEGPSDLTGDLTWDTNYTPTSPVGGAYSWSPSGQTSDNYNITYNNGNITVEPRDIEDTDVTIAEFDALTYNAENRKPTTITGSFKGTAFTDADYNLTYLKAVTVNATTGEITGTDANTDAEEDEFTNAGLYAVVIAGDGNFTGEVTKLFTINPKTLGIRTVDQTVVYDAADHYDDATTVTVGTTIELDGLQGDDSYPDDVLTAGTITLTLEKDNEVVDEAVNAGVYKVKFGDMTGVTSANYTLKPFPVGKYTISQRVVKITVKNKSKEFGTTDPYKVGVVATAADVIVEEGVANQGLLPEDEPNPAHVIDAYPMLKREGDEAKGSYDLKLVEDADHKLVIKMGDDDVTANYDPQFEKGTFTIGEGNIGIWADTKTKTYGEVTVGQAKAMLTASIIGMNDNEINQIQSAVNAKVVLTVPEGLEDTDLLPANEEGYAISFADFEAADVIPAGILANYSSEITKYSENAKFIVNKKALTVKPATQAHLVGEAVTATANANTIEFSEEVATEADAKAIYDALTLKYNIAYVYGVGDHEGELKPEAAEHGKDASDEPVDTGDGIYVDGIIITEASVNAYNEAANNYTLTAEAGQLTVSATDVVKFDAKAEDNSTEDVFDNANRKLNVTILNKKLKAGRWYTISLPFATTPFEFCGAIGGYAIFDRLQKTGDKLSFKISLDAIPAYTPFLVKVEKEVDLATVVFNNVFVETPTIVKTEANNVWKIVNTIDYAQVDGLVYWLEATSTESIVLGRSTTGTTFRGFDAYITTLDGKPRSEARIFIEEPDGSTTAISTIAADGEMIPAEGWFTLNGVKLQSMPTEKGVYINNGKKVVIK